MLYRRLAVVLALATTAVCGRVSAQVTTGTPVRFYRVFVDDASFNIHRRDQDPPCGYGGSMKEFLAEHYDFMIGPTNPELDWTMHTDTTGLCPGFFAPRIHLHALWRPTFLEQAPGLPPPEDFVDLQVLFTVDENTCRDEGCGWFERVETRIFIKEFVEVGSQEIPERREEFSVESSLPGTDWFDGEMFIRVKIERVNLE